MFVFLMASYFPMTLIQIIICFSCEISLKVLITTESLLVISFILLPKAQFLQLLVMPTNPIQIVNFIIHKFSAFYWTPARVWKGTMN